MKLMFHFKKYEVFIIQGLLQNEEAIWHAWLEHWKMGGATILHSVQQDNNSCGSWDFGTEISHIFLSNLLVIYNLVLHIDCSPFKIARELIKSFPPLPSMTFGTSHKEMTAVRKAGTNVSIRFWFVYCVYRIINP